MLPIVDCKKLFTNDAVAEDELEEVSIYKRIETINNLLFVEYGSELLVYRQEMGLKGGIL